jgi:membrane protease YdiL (CAAX protease family)
LDTLTPYLALAILPIVHTQVPNPVGVWWYLKNKKWAPMPSDIAEKADRAGRYTLFLIHSIVVILVLLLMRRYSVRTDQIGLDFRRWKFHLLVGSLVGLIWSGLGELQLRFSLVSRKRLAAHYLREGSFSFWLVIFLIGAFAEEFWRAFCLIALGNTGNAVSLSVVLTALAFGLGHASSRVRGVTAAIFGIVQALLFVWLRSVPTTYSAHVVANLGVLWRVRRTRQEPWLSHLPMR